MEWTSVNFFIEAASSDLSFDVVEDVWYIVQLILILHCSYRLLSPL